MNASNLHVYQKWQKGSAKTDFIIMAATHNSTALPSNNYLFATFTWGSCVRITKTKTKTLCLDPTRH